MLSVRGLRVDYAGVLAVRGVDFDVAEHEFVALVGANGAGKSSVLAALSGLHRPVGGTITFDGHEISRLPAHRIARLGVSLVPEGRRLFAHLSVARNLSLGAFGRDPSRRQALTERVFALFPVLARRLDQAAGTLSGGEQQMLAIGRALMAEPRLLMLDEPSLGVAPKLVDDLFSVVRDLHAAGTTVLLVEQHVHRALEMADRAYVLQTGVVAQAGPARALLDTDEIRRAYLGM